jgi:L-threonylcarbamoyladenylate synthase
LREASFTDCLDTLLGGGVVALPTETVYGLACLALDEQAVQKVFELKQRPPTNPLIVHVLNFCQAEQIAHVNSFAKLLCQKFWPGPLTLILPKRQLIPDCVTAGLDTVAVRSPSHPLFRKILQDAEQPIAAPSANPFSRVSSTTPQEVFDSFGKACPPILDGGKCNIGLESTVLDLTSDNPSILRSGPISKSELEEFLGFEIFNSPKTTDSRVARKSPGLSAKHYAPETPIRLYKNISEIKQIEHWSADDLIILPSKDLIAGFNSKSATIITFSTTGNAEDIARNLYATLKQADRLEKKLIHLALLKETNGLAEAVNDRLTRASSS